MSGKMHDAYRVALIRYGGACGRDDLPWCGRRGKGRVVTYGESCHESVHEQVHLYSRYGQQCRLGTPVALYFWW